MLHVVVDGANVVGSRPDGWWHDRAGAARRLAGQLVATLAQDPVDLAAALTGPPGTPPQVHLVLEGAARAADLPTHPQLAVLFAPADGDSFPDSNKISALGVSPVIWARLTFVRPRRLRASKSLDG